MAVWSSRSHDFCLLPSEVPVGGADRGPPPVLPPPGLIPELLAEPPVLLEVVETKVEVEMDGDTYAPEVDASSDPRLSDDGESAMMY